MATQLIKGNTAIIIGAMYAGCDCYFGYPITPATEILHEASKYFPIVGRKFVQAESEEAAINMVYGASAAGHRVMTASSGPGISLKQEGISFLAGAELPCVVVDIMRAGPGLGNIGPEQSDYTQMVKGGGHGNYRNIVLAPNSVQEMCDFTMKAFELAEKYRNPVVILADGVLGQMVEPLKFPIESVEPKIDVTWAVCGTMETKNNLVTSIFLNFEQLENFNYRLQSRIARSAVDLAREEGIKTGLFRLKTLFPFPNDKLKKIAEKLKCSFISVEMSNGQMMEDIILAINCNRTVELVNRMGGNLMDVDSIMNKIREVSVNSKEENFHE